MGLISFVFTVMFALSASISGAIGTSHVDFAEHNHAAMGEVVEDQIVDCLEASEHTQCCHALLALPPSEFLHGATPMSCEVVIMRPALLLTGIQPSGPLDPPRLV